MIAYRGKPMNSFDLFQVAEIELSYKTNGKASQRPKIAQSIDAFEVLLNHWDENKIGFVEQAKVLVLNRANHVLGICDISTGGVTGTVVDPKLVFIAAIKKNACSIILSHNHPSGNLTPSKQDEMLTQRLEEAGKLLDIRLLDHLIVSEEGYYSFMDQQAYTADYIHEHHPSRMLRKLKIL